MSLAAGLRKHCSQMLNLSANRAPTGHLPSIKPPKAKEEEQKTKKQTLENSRKSADP